MAWKPVKRLVLSDLKTTNNTLEEDRTPEGDGSVSPEYTPREGDVSFCPS